MPTRRVSFEMVVGAREAFRLDVPKTDLRNESTKLPGIHDTETHQTFRKLCMEFTEDAPAGELVALDCFGVLKPQDTPNSPFLLGERIRSLCTFVREAGGVFAHPGDVLELLRQQSDGADVLLEAEHSHLQLHSDECGLNTLSQNIIPTGIGDEHVCSLSLVYRQDFGQPLQLQFIPRDPEQWKSRRMPEDGSPAYLSFALFFRIPRHMTWMMEGGVSV